MTDLTGKGADAYLSACRQHLNTIEAGLFSIEKGGPGNDGELIDGVFQTMHAVSSGAGLYDFVKIGELAQQAEKALDSIRARKAAPTPAQVGVLLEATDNLRELVRTAGVDGLYRGSSNHADSAEVMGALAKMLVAERPVRELEEHLAGSRLRMLLVEDDFVSRLLLQTFLSRYGECHVAVNGREAVEAVRSSLEGGHKYDLICMDIMMPEMDGHEAVRRIRALEEAQGILWNCGAKIIMTTAVDDIKEVFRCFLELCDAYLVKPIDLSALLGKMKSYHLVP